MRTTQIPDDDDVFPIPPPIAAAAGTDAIKPVWLNEVGGLTFQLGSGSTRRFAKWAPRGSGLDLPAEAARLRWAVDYTPVPVVLAAGSDDEGDWLITAGLPGNSAVADPWRDSPRLAVQAAGYGLRQLHDALPVNACPFDWSISARLGQRSLSGLQSGSLDPALAVVPDIDRLVVCHGDPCVPNTLLLDDGTWTGHVDLDALGVADRWADLAVASMSLGWNYGDGWEGVFFEAYGIAPDPARIAFYRAVWTAT